MFAKKLISEANIHFFFDLSLWIKGLFALCEIIAGMVLYLFSQEILVTFLTAAMGDEFSEDPRDIVVSTLLHAIQNISISTQHFAGLYLLSHGAIKLWLIIGLLRERLWYYPVALVVFGLFIAYQLYRFSITHSGLLLLLTALDLVVIALTWHEYRYLRRRTSTA